MSILRREFLIRTGALAVASQIGSERALAASLITATEWGGNYITEIQKIASEFEEVNINWQMIGASTALTQLKATWPNPKLDLIVSWDPTFRTVVQEGWAEPVTPENVPNILDVPDKLLIKDNAGNVINIPRTISAVHWFFRRDTVPFEIQSLDDLLDPRLKGQILFPAPSINSNLQMVALALHKGGDERHMDPAWEFVKQLAKAGNIAAVAKDDTDVTTAISTGEASISFASASFVADLRRGFDIEYLTKREAATGFRTFIFQEGWSVIKGPNSKAAFDFVNFAINPENNAAFNAGIFGAPVNAKAKAPDSIKHIVFNNEELEKYTYMPDWAYLSEQADAWTKRWEQEIVPLL